MKVCTNKNCKFKGELLPLDSFHKKGNAYSSRCKKCVNKEKKEKRRKDKRKILQSFNVRVLDVNRPCFVEGLRLLLEEGVYEE